MRLRALALALVVWAAPARAAQARNLCYSCVEYDNPLPGVGFDMPRYGWHALYPLSAAGLTRELVSHGVSRIAAGAVSCAAFGVVPHVLGGLVLHHYPVDRLDWSFDAFTRCAPLWWQLDSHRVRWRAALAFAAGYALLSPYASP